MVRLGVIGYGGRMACLINESFRKVDPDLRVVGIVDPNENHVRSLLSDCDKKDVVFYNNIPEMLKKCKIDALAVGTKCNLHASYAIEASKYDLPLFLEKPVATNMKDAVLLERAFEKSKCKVVVSFPLRVSKLCALAKQCIENNVTGSPEHILAVNYVPYGTTYFETDYRNYEFTQGLFIQKATHDLDYMMYLMGSNIIRIAAMGTFNRVFGGHKKNGLKCSCCSEAYECFESPTNRMRNGSGYVEDHLCPFGIDCGSVKTGINEDSSSALLEFAGGVHGVYTQIFFSRRDSAARGTTISGYNGTISFDWYRNEMKVMRHHEPFSDIVKGDSSLRHFGGDLELAYDFIGLVKGKAKIRSTISAGIQSVYACLAAKESMCSGKFVKVRQVGQI